MIELKPCPFCGSERVEVNYMVNCEFCKKIWNSKKAYQESFESHWDEENSIVMQNDEPWLYIPIEMDSYYSDTYMQINFCPKCGRQINPKYKVIR